MSGPDVDALVADVRDSIRPRGPFLGEDRLRQSERDRVDESLAALDSLAALARSAAEMADAAHALWHFLEHEKEVREPPRELLDLGYAALETHADYEREEELTDALGAALARSREQQEGT